MQFPDSRKQLEFSHAMNFSELITFANTGQISHMPLALRHSERSCEVWWTRCRIYEIKKELRHRAIGWEESIFLPPFFFAFSPISICHRFFPSMKMAESREIILERCIIDFDEIQGGPGALSLSCNICKYMMAFLNLSGRVLKKTIITLHIQRFKLKTLNQNYF